MCTSPSTQPKAQLQEGVWCHLLFGGRIIGSSLPVAKLHFPVLLVGLAALFPGLRANQLQSGQGLAGLAKLWTSLTASRSRSPQAFRTSQKDSSRGTTKKTSSRPKLSKKNVSRFERTLTSPGCGQGSRNRGFLLRMHLKINPSSLPPKGSPATVRWRVSFSVCPAGGIAAFEADQPFALLVSEEREGSENLRALQAPTFSTGQQSNKNLNAMLDN